MIIALIIDKCVDIDVIILLTFIIPGTILVLSYPKFSFPNLDSSLSKSITITCSEPSTPQHMAPVMFLLRAGSWTNESYDQYSYLVPKEWDHTDNYQEYDIIVGLSKIQLVSLADTYNVTCNINYLSLKMDLTILINITGR